MKLTYLLTGYEKAIAKFSSASSSGKEYPEQPHAVLAPMLSHNLQHTIIHFGATGGCLSRVQLLPFFDVFIFLQTVACYSSSQV